MFEVRRLRVLREVALQGSMAAAARSLGFTPSAISQQIALLEREVGIDLTERCGRSVRLTDAGTALVKRADVVLDELTRAQADIDAIRDARAGSLNIGAFPTSGTELVPSALRIFAASHPDVNVRLVELEPENSLPALRRAELDLALVFECDLVALGSDESERETLFFEPMYVVHAEGRFGASDGPIDLVDLRDEDWIVPAAGTAIHDFTLRACEAVGFRPHVGSVWTDFQVVQSLAGQGFGVAFVPELALSPRRRNVVARRTTTPFQRKVIAAWRPGTARAPLLMSIVEAFREASVLRG